MKTVTWTHKLNRWNSRRHWKIRLLCCGDCENWVDVMAERLEEQSCDKCDAEPQFFANYELDVFIEVHMDDLHGTGPGPALDLVQANLALKIRFKSWTMNEVGMKYAHFMRERVLYNDRTEIVPNAKYLRVVLRSMELTNCKPAPTPSVAVSVKQKPDDDAGLNMQQCKLTVELLGACSTCHMVVVTCNSRRMVAQRR